MRTTVVVWSTVSGIVLGLFIDATLIGVGLLVAAAIPGATGKVSQRWLAGGALLLLAAIPAVAGVFGFLEGRLKAI